MPITGDCLPVNPQFTGNATLRPALLFQGSYCCLLIHFQVICHGPIRPKRTVIGNLGLHPKVAGFEPFYFDLCWLVLTDR